jgi:hypothetical protein
MSPNAVKVRTSSGWQDIAIQGAQGPPGRTPSCKAQSSFSFAAADTYYRGMGVNFATVIFDDFGNSFNPANVWTCRQTGRYLCIASYFGLTASGAVGLTMDSGKKMHSASVTKGADGNAWGTECIWIGDYTVGNTLGLAGYHSGGGSGTLIFEAIRLDAPPIYVRSSAPMRVTPAEFAALTPVDGLEVYLRVDDAAGVVWHLRYNAGSSSAYKWEFIGGPPLNATMPDYDSIASATFVAGAHNGPLITLPRNGDYIAAFNADVRPPASVWAGCGVAWPGSGPTNDEAIWAYGGTGGTTATNAATIKRTGVTAGVATMHFFSQAGSALMGRRWMTITPVRLS